MPSIYTVVATRVPGGWHVEVPVIGQSTTVASAAWVESAGRELLARFTDLGPEVGVFVEWPTGHELADEDLF